MLSSELEICLNEAFQGAREARHEFMTVEHLLLAIIDTPKVREILRACGSSPARGAASSDLDSPCEMKLTTSRRETSCRPSR